MTQALVHIALVVKDYDEAIDFYTKKLHFNLIEDTYQQEQDKRWVVVSPPGAYGTTVLLAKASKPVQEPFIGNQAGGRVFLFLGTDDFYRDFEEMKQLGITFIREPKEQDYGIVAVFEDLYGNLWDLVQFHEGHPMADRVVRKETALAETIKDQTNRALWEVKNVIDCVPDELWNKEYAKMPCWKHIYHMLHSLELWFINPRDKEYREPGIHEKDLNNLDVFSVKQLTREEINHYFKEINRKLTDYLLRLTDDQLTCMPGDCEYNRFTLVLAQFRHLHTHMGMVMGFIIADTGLWPRVLGLENPVPTEEYSKYF